MRPTKSANRLVVSLSAFVLLSLLIIGCQSYPKNIELSPEQHEKPPVPEPVVRLNPGDILDIRFFYNPELNTVQTVRPDGRIALQLVGEKIAQGKTPEELRQELLQSYEEFVTQIDVTVIVQEFGHRLVYVGGQVQTPGPVPMPGPMTALEAVLLAGGVNLDSGKYKTVLVIRRSEDGWLGHKIDLKDVFKKNVARPYFLQPLDIVYVPERNIAKVNRWIDQHIGQILPQVGFSYNIDPGGDNFYSIDFGYTLGE
jgi:protein involved in polysaccharide export with SLBB domain